jgi:hypothetical protein
VELLAITVYRGFFDFIDIGGIVDHHCLAGIVSLLILVEL